MGGDPTQASRDPTVDVWFGRGKEQGQENNSGAVGPWS